MCAFTLREAGELVGEGCSGDRGAGFFAVSECAWNGDIVRFQVEHSGHAVKLRIRSHTGAHTLTPSRLHGLRGYGAGLLVNVFESTD